MLKIDKIVGETINMKLKSRSRNMDSKGYKKFDWSTCRGDCYMLIS